MFSILVEPVAETDIWLTKWKRPIENKIIEKYLEKQTKK
jgi:predicted HAD superfamily phosphohydrolase YqeG